MKKRVLSLILALVMVFSLLPVNALAANDGESSEVRTDDVSFEGTSSLGTLLTRTIESSDAAESDYPGSIADVSVEGTQATVEFTTDRPSELVVAVYPEEGTQMLGSGHVAVSSEDKETQVFIEIDEMPEYYNLGVYLLDADTREPLCEQFISRYYTKNFQDFLATDINDYDSDLVINLDDQTDTNFLVFHEGVLTSKTGDNSNQVVDNGDGTYTILNADEQFLDLSEGDTFVYQNPDKSLLVVVVAFTQVSGDTVIVTEKPDADLSDVFDIVKIEADSNTPTSIDTSVMDEGVTLLEESEAQNHIMSSEGEEGEDTSGWSLPMSISDPTGFVTGSVTLSVKAKIKVYISPSWKFVKLSLEDSASLSVTIKAETPEIDIPLPGLTFVIVPTLNLQINVSIVITATIKGTLSGALTTKRIFIYDSDGQNSFTRTTKFEGEIKASGSVFVGLKLRPNMTFLTKDWVELAFTATCGVEATVTAYTTKKDDDKDHPCARCFPGKLVAKGNAKVTLTVFKKSVLPDKSLNWDFLEYKLFDFYIRYDPNTRTIKFSKGTCPYISYKVTVVTEDTNGKPVQGVRISYTGKKESGEPVAAVVGEFTDENGEKTFFLPNGVYKLTATYLDNSNNTVYGRKTITIKDEKKSIHIVLDHTGGEIDSGKCGKGLEWRLFEDGVLTISGSGKMDKYTSSKAAPWVDYLGSIQVVMITDGVTTIGDYAFMNCSNLTTISIPDTITSIGDYSLSGCKALTTVNIPNSVTSIGKYSLSGCEKLTSVYFTNSISIIPEGAFHDCTALTDVSFGGTEEEWNQVTIGDNNAPLLAATIHFVSPYDPSLPGGVISLGECGANLSWILTTDGVLTITGGGRMDSYLDKLPPWEDYLDKITIIDIRFGVSSIGGNAFHNCINLSVACIQDITVIENGAFNGCNALTDVYYGGLEEEWTYVSIEENNDPLQNATIHYGSSGIPEPQPEVLGTGKCGANITWTLTDDGVMTISGIGNMTSYDDLNSVRPWRNLLDQIKTVIIHPGVTCVGAGAFDSCHNLTSVELPDSVSAIWRGAFYACTSLTNVTIPQGVTSIESNTFANCSSLLSVTIPDSVTKIDGAAFKNCSNLIDATIPHNVTYIGGSAFMGCSSLVSVTIPGGVTEILFNTFRDCTGLKSLTIMDGVENILGQAFSGCSSLTSLTIPGSVTRISSFETFENCNSLKNIIITDLSAWCRIPFDSVSANPLIYGADLYLDRTKICDLIIPDDVVSIGQYTFSGCGSLTSVTIPSSVTSIGASAFSNCSNLTSLTLSSSVTSLGANSFSGCSNLGSIVIPSSVTSLGASAFSDCSNLISATLSSNMTSLESHTFSGCSSLSSIVIPSSVTSIGSSAFYGCSNLVSVAIPSNLSNIEAYAFYGCSSLVSIEIPSNITSIKEKTFCGCTCLANVTIPSTMTDVGTEAFSECNMLKDVFYDGTIGQWLVLEIASRNDSLNNARIHFTELDYVAYCGICGENLIWTLVDDGILTISGSGEMYNYMRSWEKPTWYIHEDFIISVVIDSGVTSIGEDAFCDCHALTSLSIPISVTNIYDGAFYDCYNLVDVYYEGTKEEWDSINKGNNFSSYGIIIHCSDSPDDPDGGCGQNLTWEIVNDSTLVISGTGEMYDFEYDPAPWGDIRDSITEIIVESGVTSIGDYAFNGCPNLLNVTLPASITSIGNDAFASCSALSSISLPSGLISIGVGAFSYCESLTSVYYPPSVKSIGASAFYSCSGLKSITFSTGLESIGYSAFGWCTGLTSVSLPNSVTSIGENAFVNCWNMTTISIPASVTSIGEGAFYGCNKLNSIIVDNENEYYSTDDQGALYDKGKTIIIFCPRTTSGSFIIPNSVTIIGDQAFDWCTELTDITIPENLRIIGEYAFNECNNLQSIYLPNSLESIGASAFASCHSLTSLTIPEGITVIEDSTFQTCYGLTSINLPSGLTSIGESAFYNSNSITTIVFPSEVSYIGARAFSWCGNLRSVTFPASVNSIGYRAFHYCTSLTQIAFQHAEDDWISIDAQAFNAPSDTVISTSVFVRNNTSINPYIEEYDWAGDNRSVTYELYVDGALGASPYNFINSVDTETTEKEDVEEDQPENEVIHDPDEELVPAPETTPEPEAVDEAAPTEEPSEQPAEPEPVEQAEPTEEPGEQPSEAFIEPLAMYTPNETGAGLARFTGLVPNAPYVFLVTVGNDEPASLEAEDLLYIAQANANAEGRLAITYVPRVSSAVACTRVYGASSKSLSDAVIVVEQFTGGKFQVYVFYNGVEIVEDQDYLLFVNDKEDTVTVTIRGRGEYSGMQTVQGDKYPEETKPITLKLGQKYLILSMGENAQLRANVNPAVYASLLTWSVESNPSVVSVSDDGTITALGEGTAWIRAELTANGETLVDRCRIDVVAGNSEDHPVAGDVAKEANGVSGIRLTSNKAIVELFKTDYTRIQVIPELTKNNVTANAVVLPTPEPEEDAGMAIEAAQFTEDAVAALFSLRVADDRTLEVIPTKTALKDHASVKKSYTSTISVTVDGSEFTTEKITLTVKKTEPKIKAKTLTLNSYFADIQTITFTGADVISVFPDPDKQLPDWLMWDNLTDSFTYVGTQGAKKSAKISLLVIPEGWCVQLPVTVSVSAKSTAPKLTFKPASLTLKPGTGDGGTVTWKLSPAAFEGQEVTLSRITEGKSARAADTELNVEIYGDTVSVTAPYVDGKAHTYKVYLAVAGKETAFTVKTLADKSAVSLTLKAKGVIDLTVPESPVTVTATTKNYHTDQASFAVTSICKAKTTEDVQDLFNVSISGNVITLTANGEPLTGTYTAKVAAYVGADEPVTKSVNFTVKRSAANKVPVSVSLKAAGSIDVLRPGTSVTLTPTVKNDYTYELAPADLKITKTYDGATKAKVNVDATDLFDVSVQNGKYVVAEKAFGTILHTDKFSVQATVEGVTSKAVTLKVAQGKAKVNQSVKAVTLLKTDRYSRGEVVLTLPDKALAGIAKVEFTGSNAALFSLTDLGNGKYAIGYAGNLITTTKAQTVKLRVFLDGNLTGTPNATISVKVNIK